RTRCVRADSTSIEAKRCDRADDQSVRQRYARTQAAWWQGWLVPRDNQELSDRAQGGDGLGRRAAAVDLPSKFPSHQGTEEKAPAGLGGVLRKTAREGS